MRTNRLIEDLYDALDDLGFTGVQISHRTEPLVAGSATEQQRLALEARALRLPSLYSRVRRLLTVVLELLASGRQARDAARRRPRHEDAHQLPLPLAWA